MKRLARTLITDSRYHQIASRLRRLPHTRLGYSRRLMPLSRSFGGNRGRPIDRVYIDAFIKRQSADIRGRVLELEDPAYTLRYGGAAVRQSDVLHSNSGNPEATMVGDLSTGEGIPSGAYDCMIVTQTLQLIYDIGAAIATCHDALKPGGVLLVTVPGIAQYLHWVSLEWEDHWRLSPMAVQRLHSDVFGAENVSVAAHGNVRVATAFLYGLAAQELRRKDFAYDDPEYPLIVTARAVKRMSG
jgi:SAM-dependent methyltransferase